MKFTQVKKMSFRDGLVRNKQERLVDKGLSLPMTLLSPSAVNHQKHDDSSASGGRRDEQQQPYGATQDEKLLQLLEQAENDRRTHEVLQQLAQRRLDAQDELRVASDIAKQRLDEVRADLQSYGATQQTLQQKLPESSRAIPSAAHLTTPQTSAASARALTTPMRRIDPSLKARKLQPVGECGSEFVVRLAPTTPASESLPVMLGSHLSSTSRTDVPPTGGRATAESRTAIYSPRPATRNAPSSSASLANVLPASPPMAMSHHEPFLPLAFNSSHFHSILKWAEMSFEEAIVAARGSLHGVADGDKYDSSIPTVALRGAPSALLSTACGAIVDEILMNLPGFSKVWEKMRPELFSGMFIFTETAAGVTSSKVSQAPTGPLGRAASSRSSNRTKPQTPQESDGGGNSSGRNLPSSSSTTASGDRSWFSRVCAKRKLYFQEESKDKARIAELEQKLSDMKSSVEKYDKIFDVFGRTAEMALKARTFTAWRTYTRRQKLFETNISTMHKRQQRKPMLLASFHGWRRVTLTSKLKASKDKVVNASAAQEAKLRLRASELERIQKQLELETEKFRNQVERETRRMTAMATQHAVEIRELQGMQHVKDDLIMSLEKIAKRWERVAKTYRPGISRMPPSRGLLRSARALQSAEFELATKGPSPHRNSKARDELDRLLVEWVNNILDEQQSRVRRITNTTTDVRDGEALMFVCKHIIQVNRDQTYNAGGPTQSGGGTSRGGGAALFSPATTVPTTLFGAVIQALYLGTSQGLFPPLISSCPFANKILNKDAFLESLHPTAGMWILASLFIAQMLQTAAYLPDLVTESGENGNRFGCDLEPHLRHSMEVSLMLTDRPAGTTYTARKMSTKGLVQAVLRGPSASAKTPTGNAAVGDFDDGLDDTASDIAAYFAEDQGDDMVNASQMDDGDEPLPLLPATLNNNNNDNGVVALTVTREKENEATSSSDSDDKNDDDSGGDSDHDDDHQRRREGGFTAMGSFANVRSPTVASERGDISKAWRPSPVAGVVSPQALPELGAGKDRVAEKRERQRALPPVRKDLRQLQMHQLVKQLRKEERYHQSWVGMARLVTSVVLRFRCLDFETPIRQRGSVSAVADAPVAAPTPSGLLPSAAAASQQRSRSQSQTSVSRPAPPATVQGSVAGGSNPAGGYRRGSTFFPTDTADMTPTAADGRRGSTAVTFE